MTNTGLIITAFALAGLVTSPLAVQAKSQSEKDSKHHTSSITTGANTKSSKATTSKGVSANPSSQGNVGPGTTNTPGSQPAGK